MGSQGRLKAGRYGVMRGVTASKHNRRSACDEPGLLAGPMGSPSTLEKTQGLLRSMAMPVASLLVLHRTAGHALGCCHSKRAG